MFAFSLINAVLICNCSVQIFDRYNIKKKRRYFRSAQRCSLNSSALGSYAVVQRMDSLLWECLTLKME